MRTHFCLPSFIIIIDQIFCVFKSPGASVPFGMVSDISIFMTRENEKSHI